MKKVYQSLSSRLTLEKKETEVSALFALAGRHMSTLAARTGNKSVSTFFLPLAVRPGAVETQRQEQFLKSYAAWRALRKDTP